MVLLSRVAENLYWSSRYLERAEGTARLARTYTEVMVDLPTSVSTSWEPLLAITGSTSAFRSDHRDADETSIVSYLVADLSNPNSVASSVGHARENLRACRDVIPSEAWTTVNDLHLFVSGQREAGVARRSRARVLTRIIDDARRVDGVMSSSMSHDDAYCFLRLGWAIERADMTTRVLGVRAAELLTAAAGDENHDEVQWMSVLRSRAALQMYQRASAGPIDGGAVVRFLLFDETFPQSVAFCATECAAALAALPHSEITAPAVRAVTDTLSTVRPVAGDGWALDAAADALQVAIAALSDAVMAAFTGVAALAG